MAGRWFRHWLGREHEEDSWGASLASPEAKEAEEGDEVGWWSFIQFVCFGRAPDIGGNAHALQETTTD